MATDTTSIAPISYLNPYTCASWRRGFDLYWEHPWRHAGRWLMFMGRRAGGRRLVRLRDASGHRLVSPRHNFTAMAVAVLGERDPDIMRLLRREVKAGDVVFDVGANIGTYTLPLAKLVGGAGQVVAFEPNRPTRACLRANVRTAGFAKVAVIAAAAGPSSGRVSLVSPNDNPGEVHVSLDVAGEIAMTTLDETAARLRITEVRYIKIDIEGFELEALRGAEALLRDSPRLLVQTEVVPSHAARFGYGWAELRDFFAERGYLPHRCTQEGKLVPQMEFAEEVGDWFWCRPETAADGGDAEIGRPSALFPPTDHPVGERLRSGMTRSVEIYRTLRRNITEDGLIVGSSPHLVRAMLDKVDFSRPLRIIEVGSGKGAFTREILKRMAPGSELHICEIKRDYNPFIEALIARHPEHDVTFSNSCVTEMMDSHGGYDVIISSLPLKNFARMKDGNGFLNRIIGCFHRGLKDGGMYLQYQYFRSNKRDIETAFGKAMDQVDFVPLNVPPAFVYHMRKSGNESQ